MRRLRPLRLLVAMVLMLTIPSATDLRGQATAPTANVAATIPAGDAATDDPELRAIHIVRHELVDAFNHKDVDRLLSHLHPDIIVTWQNGEVSKGKEAVRAYYERMMVGENRIVESLSAVPVIEGRTIRGDTSISYGHMNDTFFLRDGLAFRLDSRFSAWLTRENGRWLVHGFHISGNIFENEIQKAIIGKVTRWVGGIGVVIGLGIGAILGAIIAERRARRRAATSAS